jgi:hypothetical protein
MPREEDEMTFHVRREREHHIRCQQREITSDSMSEEEDEMTFHVRREREYHIRCQQKEIK